MDLPLHFPALFVECAQSFVEPGRTIREIRLHKRMSRQGGDVKLCAVHGLIPQVLQVTKLDSMIELYPDVNRARLAFRPRTEPSDTSRPLKNSNDV